MVDHDNAIMTMIDHASGDLTLGVAPTAPKPELYSLPRLTCTRKVFASLDGMQDEEKQHRKAVAGYEWQPWKQGICGGHIPGGRKAASS